MLIPTDTETRDQKTSRIASLLAPYRRITSSGAFIPEIDGFRFVAILYVFVYHLSENIEINSSAHQLSVIHENWMAQMTRVLSIGVPLFFVVSGFVLGMPFAEMHLKGGKRVSLKKYFLRRVTRLEPPYILCLFLLLAVKLVSRGGLAQYLPHFLASLFYVHNAIYATFSTINVVAWSLEIEVQFYILAPILGLVFLIKPLRFRRLVLCLLIMATTCLSHAVANNSRLALSLAGYAQYFFAGLLLADIHVVSNGRYRPGWAWDAVSLVGWPLQLVILTWAPAFVVWIAPWLTLLLYQSAFRGVLVRQFWVNPIVTTIGGMCYTIYLLHNYLIYGLGMVTERVLIGSAYELRLAIQFALMTPVVLLISGLYFRLVERPCMRPDWPKRLLENTRAVLNAAKARDRRKELADEGAVSTEKP
jgi:peptidoglycan/LPS O-acetylase OafA/YrhL